MPQLEALLTRADRLTEPAGYATGLFALFGIETPPGADLPTAAVCHFADTGEASAACLLHADPLQLVPDRDTLLAFGLDDDPLDDTETAQLVAAFNDHFADQGLRLQPTSAGRLYLQCETAPAIRTHALSTVIGRDLDRFLPSGDDRRRWRGLLNETQMLCHALTGNHEREARGRATLGGLWFSGAGRLPSPGRGPVVRQLGDCPLARGLVALRPGSGDTELVVEHAPRRAVERADAHAWLQALVELDRGVPALARDCDELHVHVGNGTVYRWQPRHARRWWRRRRPLRDQLDAVAATPRVADG